MRHKKAQKYGLILLVLLLSLLSGCIRERIVYQCPVSAYTAETKPPANPDFSTEEGKLKAYGDMSKSLGSCNADKAEIRSVVEKLSHDR